MKTELNWLLRSSIMSIGSHTMPLVGCLSALIDSLASVFDLIYEYASLGLCLAFLAMKYSCSITALWIAVETALLFSEKVFNNSGDLPRLALHLCHKSFLCFISRFRSFVSHGGSQFRFGIFAGINVFTPCS